MKDRYELTVIISNYNQENHLSETVDSALNQKVSFPVKIIITDDHSTGDRSKKIIEDYAKKYDNIEPIFADENKGYLTNILRAKERTKTKYFCLLDAEDYWTDRGFLQRAYDFLEEHREYTIYESNVEVLKEDVSRPFLSPRVKSGTYSKEMYLNNESVPITQTTGMFLRNAIFINGIPNIMKEAVGTRSERSFEGDTGRFIMHLKEGLAYYDRRLVGVYRLTENGIWNRLPRSEKRLISARMQLDYYQYYGSDVSFFVSKAFYYLQAYLDEKRKELTALARQEAFMDENEKLMLDDVYCFCKKNENEIIRKKSGVKEKARQMLRIIRA